MSRHGPPHAQGSSGPPRGDATLSRMGDDSSCAWGWSGSVSLNPGFSAAY